jgi:hypothetical protein
MRIQCITLEPRFIGLVQQGPGQVELRVIFGSRDRLSL